MFVQGGDNVCCFRQIHKEINLPYLPITVTKDIQRSYIWKTKHVCRLIKSFEGDLKCDITQFCSNPSFCHYFERLKTSLHRGQP